MFDDIIKSPQPQKPQQSYSIIDFQCNVRTMLNCFGKTSRGKTLHSIEQDLYDLIKILQDQGKIKDAVITKIDRHEIIMNVQIAYEWHLVLFPL